jgi:predicted enzyme related to lactoylglutathione lyase
MGVRIGNVGIDTNDMEKASNFWQKVTGYQVSSSDDTSTYLEDPNKDGPGISLLLVPEPRKGKNRLHLDLYASDMNGEVKRIKKLGATEVKSFADGNSGWVVLADTDGNQFCVVAQ